MNGDSFTHAPAGDEAEVRGEEDHGAAHKKFVDIIRKFSEKLQAAEKRYHGRMAELDGAMNPEAENMARERWEQEKQRLQVSDNRIFRVLFALLSAMCVNRGGIDQSINVYSDNILCMQLSR